jgi:acyl-CoA thioesterase II
MDLATMLSLEPHGPDVFVGTGPSYPWGGLYGGQIVAQSLRAAGETVDPQFRVHSLHAYFIRPGDADEPIRFEVDRIRNGRSFVTRRVVARQSIGAIFNLAASFQVDEPGTAVQAVDLPDVPRPDGLPDGGSWSTMFERRFVPSERPGWVAAWLRLSDALPDDPFLHACALAYVSDDIPTDAVLRLHPDLPRDADDVFDLIMSASLDHAIWFHRPFTATGWQLHEFTCHSLMSSRGVAVGHVFIEDGTHVATVSQEVLVRPRRDSQK